MAFYRKKPVVIEAFEVLQLIWAANTKWSALPQCIVDSYDAGKLLFLPDGIQIETLEGWHFGGTKDFIIKGVAGELCPCKPEIFAATYELVEA